MSAMLDMPKVKEERDRLLDLMRSFVFQGWSQLEDDPEQLYVEVSKSSIRDAMALVKEIEAHDD